MRIYMQQPAQADHAPKFYQIILEKDLLEGWMIVKEWGRVGAGGRIKKQHFVSREDAESAMNATRDSQAKKGYQVVFIQGDTGPVL